MKHKAGSTDEDIFGLYLHAFLKKNVSLQNNLRDFEYCNCKNRKEIWFPLMLPESFPRKSKMSQESFPKFPKISTRVPQKIP